MGYAHYLERNRDFTSTEFEDMRADIARVIDVATGLGIPLQGYMANQAVVLETDEVAFNGVGDESCDEFVLTREIRTEQHNPTFTFCKTWRRNYSPVVASAMMVVKQRVPQDVMVSSNGRWDQEWIHGPHCYQEKNKESACSVIDVAHVQVSGRSLYRMAFPDSPEPRYTFESPLVSQGLEGQDFYVTRSMKCEQRGTCFVGLPFGFNLNEMLQQDRRVNAPVCLACGETTDCTIKVINSLGDDYFEGRPMCEFCYQNRLLAGKLTGYGYSFNPYRLTNSSIDDSMPAVRHGESFTAISDIPRASRSLRGMNVCATGKFSKMTRPEVNDFIVLLGGRPQPSVTPYTDILVTGQRVGATKMNKARSLGVAVMTESEFMANYG